MKAHTLAAASQTALTTQARVAAGILALLFMGVIIELIRRRRLQERYTVLWFLLGVGMVIGAAFPGLLAWVSHALGVRSEFIALFGVIALLMLGLLLHLTAVVSRQASQILILAQELALARAETESVRDQTAEESAG